MRAGDQRLQKLEEGRLCRFCGRPFEQAEPADDGRQTDQFQPRDETAAKDRAMEVLAAMREAGVDLNAMVDEYSGG
jgi:hypothetical protein